MILIIQNKILHYRKPFYNKLSENYDVVIVHSGQSNCSPDDKFVELILPATKCGPFWYQHKLLQIIASQPFEAVIAMFDVRWINSVIAMFKYDSKIPWIWWGLDEGASSIALKAKLVISRRSNPIIFYNSKVKGRFLNTVNDIRKMFVANNTFHVPGRTHCYLNPIKNKFINVGSLDFRKQNEISIIAFKKILDHTGLNLQFIIIGDGDAKIFLEQLIIRENLEEKVILIGAINDPDALRRYYSEAIATVSFGQAGLAVLQSMAYGVPFVTKVNAISGGEKGNIISGENGLFCADDPAALENAMLRLVLDPSFACKLGEKAYEHYSKNCSIQGMVEGFCQAIEYSKSHRPPLNFVD